LQKENCYWCAAAQAAAVRMDCSAATVCRVRP